MPFEPDAPSSGFIPDQPPTNPTLAMGNLGSAPEAPLQAHLYGDDFGRMRSSFADEGNRKKIAEKVGFSQVHRNKDGDLVGKYADGKWYRDLQGPHNPINWLEGHLGGSLPTIGMGVGGVVGGGLAGLAGLETGPGALATGYAGGVGGAGVGGGIGKTMQAGIGKLLGVNDEGLAEQGLEGAKEGALAEAIGKPVGALIGAIPGVKPVANYVADRTIRPAIAGASKLISLGGAPFGAGMRTLQRPKQVLGALGAGNVAKVASEGAAELEAKTRAEQELYDSAQNQFFRDAPPMIPTNNAVGEINSTLKRPGYLPNRSGYGAFDHDEVGELGRLKRSLQTRQPGFWEMAEGGAPGAPGASPEFSPTTPGKPDIEVSRAVATPGAPEPPALNTPVKSQNPLAVTNHGPGTGATGNAIDMDFNEPGILNMQSPQELAGNLQSLRQSVKPGMYNARGAAKFRSDAMAGVNKSVRRGLNKDLYGAGEAGANFGGANSRFSDFADQAELLKGIENPVTAESWAENFGGKNKSVIQDAARTTIPNTYEKLADIGAYKAFGKSDPIPRMLGPTGRGMMMLGASEGLSHMAGHPISAPLAGGLGLWGILSHPAVQRSLLGLTGRTLNEQTIPMLLHNQNPWQLGYGEGDKK